MNYEILFYAFRYALGRSTYAVDIMVIELIVIWDVAPTQFKLDVCKEITEAITLNRAGMDMDVRNWNRILEL
jgi:hypothetical protein